MGEQFNWIGFYKELADKLLAYKSNRSELIEKVYAIFSDSGLDIPKLELDGQRLIDFDPFTFYGLFNKKLSDKNRIHFAQSTAKILGISAPVPTSFEGIPVLNNLNATYYYFIDTRGDEDMNDLWGLFDAAIKYASEATQENKNLFSTYFNRVVNKKGNGNSKVTIGLYWIRPETFMNLDSRNEWYIYKSGKIPKDIVAQLPAVKPRIAADRYFSIIEELRGYLSSERSKLKNFVELSYDAWDYSQEVNEEQRLQAAAENGQKGDGLADEDVSTVHYWIYSPGNNAEKWDDFYAKGIMAIGWGVIGDLSKYSTKSEMKEAMKAKIDPSKSYKNDAHATWQFAKEMKPGDVVFVKKGMHLLVGRGVVESDYYYDENAADGYSNVRKVRWTHNSEQQHPGHAVMKALTDITGYTDYVEKLNALYGTNDDVLEEEIEIEYPEYTPEDFLNQVYMSRSSYNRLVNMLRIEKNIILQGAPGVGKTYAAKRLAYSMMGIKDQDRVMMVQFHQSYSYEDFIEGFRPAATGNGFEIRKGAFYEFCKKAADDLENEYFFIIDEINRGNISKIFGELFMLIENDKRGNELQLLYSDDKFSVPKNVYIIGMMNTADRSLALLDYALRRRFAFYEIKPGFSTDGFLAYKDSLNSAKFNNLIACVEKLNGVISEDDSLGEGFCVGHSYFCNLKEATDEALSNIVDFKIIPLLKEYWFDEPIKVREWSKRLRGAIE